MGSQVVMNVHVTTDMTSRRLNADVRVKGDESELLIPAIELAILDQLDPAFGDTIAGIEWQDPDYPERLRMIIPDGMTLGAAAEYFGDEAQSEPATILATDGGYGGEADYTYLIELVDVAVKGAGYVVMALAAQRQIVKVRYAKYRRLAKEWSDSGVVSRDLHEAVCSKMSWQRSDFDKTFGLGPSRGPELLRSRGYQRHDYYWAEVWERNQDDDAVFPAPTERD